jgi:hypothetical protein
VNAEIILRRKGEKTAAFTSGGRALISTPFASRSVESVYDPSNWQGGFVSRLVVLLLVSVRCSLLAV